MKKNLHPENNEIMVHCACGNEFKTTSTSKSIRITICSKCHPFYTGDEKYVDTAGRIEKFNKKFAKKS